jgi:UDP-N-acetylmuramoylalanine--D-glutamate ligase
MGRYLVLGRGKSGEAAAALLRERGDEVVFSEGWDGVVASPGIPVKSELQLGCEALKRLGWKLLAVTGSKGKSSVVKVVSDALNLAGIKAVPCGNYGRPVSDLVGEEPGWAVVEVSSFQLETTALANDTFEAAAVLNVQEEHLDRHGDMSVYFALKHRLSGMAKSFYGSVQQSADSMALVSGSYFDNDILRENGAYAVALMRVAGLDDVQIRRGFESFKPLPHRFQTVAETGGVRYVDDSKATSIAALVAGVAMCGASPVRLIAGGLPKGDDPKSALPILTNRAKKVYLIGKCAESFAAAWKPSIECEVCATMEKAVAAAKRDAVEGETVLLSPGAASFDQFSNFGERGDVFAALANKRK